MWCLVKFYITSLQIIFLTGSMCFSSLPEVPALVDVPCISAQLDDSLLGFLRDRVSRHGSVSSHPPVQIEELQERPGGILVRWCKVGNGKGMEMYKEDTRMFM